MFTVEEYPRRYDSRQYPYTFEDVEVWLDMLPQEDVKGLRVTICDAGMGNGRRPSQTLGQYIQSAAYHIGKPDREGLIRLFTVKVRFLKRGPVYTTWRDFKSWDKEDMLDLEADCIHTARHEVGHWVIHNLGIDVPWRVNEELADDYAFSPVDFHRMHGYIEGR